MLLQSSAQQGSGGFMSWPLETIAAILAQLIFCCPLCCQQKAVLKMMTVLHYKYVLVEHSLARVTLHIRLASKFSKDWILSGVCWDANADGFIDVQNQQFTNK